jgi:hypothetical protein
MPIIPTTTVAPTGAHIITVMHNSMRRSIAMRAAVLQAYMSLHMTRIPMIPPSGMFLSHSSLLQCCGITVYQAWKIHS